MRCDSTTILCSTQLTVGIDGTFTLSPNPADPVNRIMNFIPGNYGDLIISGPFATPEPATLLLFGMGLVDSD